MEFDGLVVELPPEERFRVQLGTSTLLSRTQRADDRVTVEMTPYDLTKGWIVFRHETDSPGPRPGAPYHVRRR